MPKPKSPSPLLSYNDMNTAQRSAARLYSRLWNTPLDDVQFDEQIINANIRAGNKLASRIKALYKNAPQKWPIDFVSVHPQFFVERRAAIISTAADFEIVPEVLNDEIVGALGWQQILNARKQGELKPRERKPRKKARTSNPALAS